MQGRGSNQTGHPYRQTQHAGAGIALSDIDQHPRTQADAREISLVGSQGDLVIAAACIKIPGDRVHPFLRQEFVLKHVDWVHTNFLSPSSFFDASTTEKV